MFRSSASTEIMSLHLSSFSARVSYDQFPDEILGPNASKKEHHYDFHQQNLTEYPPDLN